MTLVIPWERVDGETYHVNVALSGIRVGIAGPFVPLDLFQMLDHCVGSTSQSGVSIASHVDVEVSILPNGAQEKLQRKTAGDDGTAFGHLAPKCCRVPDEAFQGVVDAVCACFDVSVVLS